MLAYQACSSRLTAIFTSRLQPTLYISVRFQPYASQPHHFLAFMYTSDIIRSFNLPSGRFFFVETTLFSSTHSGCGEVRVRDTFSSLRTAYPYDGSGLGVPTAC
jgi:hypothetical protein